MKLLTLPLLLAAAFTPGPVQDQQRVRQPHQIHCTRTAVASVYGRGDGQLGNRTASGRIYTAGLLGVAHKTIRFHRRITFCFRARDHRMRTVTVPVLDRGPYVAGRTWDLMIATQDRLHFPNGYGPIGWRYGP